VRAIRAQSPSQTTASMKGQGDGPCPLRTWELRRLFQGRGLPAACEATGGLELFRRPAASCEATGGLELFRRPAASPHHKGRPQGKNERTLNGAAGQQTGKGTSTPRTGAEGGRSEFKKALASPTELDMGTAGSADALSADAGGSQGWHFNSQPGSLAGPQGKLPTGAIPEGFQPPLVQSGGHPGGYASSLPHAQGSVEECGPSKLARGQALEAGAAATRRPGGQEGPRRKGAQPAEAGSEDLSPVVSAASSKPGAASKADESRDLGAELAAAEAAIEDLQRDCLKYQLASRNLSREVDSLRFQLAEAIASDQMASNELALLAEETGAAPGGAEHAARGPGRAPGGEGREWQGERRRLAGGFQRLPSRPARSRAKGVLAWVLLSSPTEGTAPAEWSSSLGAAPQGTGGATASWMEEAHFHEEAAERLSAQVEMLQVHQHAC